MATGFFAPGVSTLHEPVSFPATTSGSNGAALAELHAVATRAAAKKAPNHLMLIGSPDEFTRPKCFKYLRVTSEALGVKPEQQLRRASASIDKLSAPPAKLGGRVQSAKGWGRD
jgi:hypothetical protein